MACTRFGILGIVGLAIGTPSIGIGDDDALKEAAENRGRHYSFVYSSKRLVDEGADREAMIDALLHIERARRDDPSFSAICVRAIYHLASDDRHARQCMLEIGLSAEDSVCCSGREAFRLLTYVANDSDREILRGIVESGFPLRANAHYALETLVELGDRPTLKWLEAYLARLPNEYEPIRPQLEASAEKIRLQQDTKKLEACLASMETEAPLRAWAVRQSLRHGIAGARIHELILAYFKCAIDKGVELAEITSIVIACDECGILTSQDATIPAVASARALLNSFSTEGGTAPSWATKSVEKRLAFYRISNSQ